MNALFLSDAQVDALCDGLTQPGAKVRYLSKQLKLRVFAKPNGRPLVAVSEFERVLGTGALAQLTASNDSSGPNVTGMAQFLEGRKHGAKAKGR